MIHDNEFRFTKAKVGCTNTLCGRNSVFSNWGVTKVYRGEVIQQAITFNQNNKWYQQRPITVSGTSNRLIWAPTKPSPSGRPAPYRQDAGSSYSATVSAASPCPVAVRDCRASRTRARRECPGDTGDDASMRKDQRRGATRFASKSRRNRALAAVAALKRAGSQSEQIEERRSCR